MSVKTIWCYTGDHGRWAQQVETIAVSKGLVARLFNDKIDYNEVEPGDYAFMRVPQWEPELSVGKTVARGMRRAGAIMIPDFVTIEAYEDKFLQAELYGWALPLTYVLRGRINRATIESCINHLTLPFLSKSRQGSASANVRLIETAEQAHRELDVVAASGLPIKVGNGRTGLQLGVVLWQKLIPGNACDYRVCVIGDHLMMLQRHNVPGTPFASGSGINNPVNEPTEFQLGALKAARKFFDAHDLKWCGIDLVYDYEGEKWMVLETTLGWSQKAYEECVFFDRQLRPTEYRGRDIFHLLADSIVAGVFQ
jgi:glutathione synthase/RimK-type ligase-like ATP-grasp enzyme